MAAGAGGGTGDSPGGAAWTVIRPWLERLDGLSRGVVVVAMAAMTIMVSLQVFWRYVLGSSIDSADEVSRLFFVWVIFLAIPHGVKYGIHVGIDLLLQPMGALAKERIGRLMAAASAALMAAVLYASWIATLDKWPELMPTLPITAAVYYIAVLVCAAHSFLHLVVRAWLGARVWGVTGL